MLSGVASLLFGSNGDKPSANNPQEKLDLITNETDQGWVLVDLPDTGKSQRGMIQMFLYEYI